MTITRVQGNARGLSTNAASTQVTLSTTPTNGNILVLGFGSDKALSAGTITSISQTGVTWTKQISRTTGSILDWYLNSEIWVGIIGANASNSITVNHSSCQCAVANVCEYSGIQTSNFLDQTATSYNNDGGVYPTTGTTPTTTQAEELWVGTAMEYGDSGQPVTFNSCTNGFTLMDGANISANPKYDCCGYVEKIVSTTGSASSTLYPYQRQYCGCIATLKAQTITQYNLTISAGTGGTTDPSPSTYTYDQGSDVQVTANPTTGYSFDHWVLDASNYTENPITVTMNSNHNLQATFTTLPLLRYRKGNETHNLRIGNEGDGRAQMGGIPKIANNGHVYDIMLVETDDPAASPVRIQTDDGIKAIECAESCQVCQACCTSCQTCVTCQTCQTGCEVSCQTCNTCQTACELSCQTACQSSCQTGCEVSCETGCEVSCQTCNTCQTTCELSCQTGCQISCQTGCEVSCQTCNTCQTTCEVSCQTGCELCQPCISCNDSCNVCVGCVQCYENGEGCEVCYDDAYT